MTHLLNVITSKTIEIAGFETRVELIETFDNEKIVRYIKIDDKTIAQYDKKDPTYWYSRTYETTNELVSVYLDESETETGDFSIKAHVVVSLTNMNNFKNSTEYINAYENDLKEASKIADWFDGCVKHSSAE